MPNKTSLTPPGAAERWWTAEAGFFLALLCGLLAAGKSKMFADPGALWHPVVGERVLQQGPFQGDPYSFMPWGTWFTKDWLAEAIFALCHRAAGPDGIQLFCAALLAGFYAWLFRRFRVLGCHPLLATLATMLAVAGTSFHFFARPLVFSLVCFGATFAILADVEAGRAPRRRLLWLPPLFVFWANCHPAVFGGVATVGLMVGVWFVRGLLGLDSPVRDWRSAAWIGATAAGTFVATMVNPFGWQLPAMAMDLMGSPLLHAMIDEHRRLFSRVELLDCCLSFAGALFVGYALWGGLRNVGAATVGTAAWLLLTVSRVRNGEYFATAFVVCVSAQWPRHPLGAAFVRRPDWFRAPDSWRPAPKFGLRAAAIPVAALALAAGLKSGGVPAPLIGAGWADLASDVAPLEALPTLREYAALARPAQPIFNDLNFGGFVIHFLPTLRVYADDRAELLRDAGLRQYANLFRDPAEIDRLADRHAIDLALVATQTPEHDSPFDRHLAASKRWRVMHRDRVATVYRRTDGGVAAAFSAIPPRGR